MTSTSFKILTLFLIIVGLGCKDNQPSKIADDEKREIIPIIHYEAYIVTVDNLRMRQMPGLESGVIRKIPEGTIVLSTGQISDFTDEITLRGRQYNQPYHKVWMKNRAEDQGWVYGGALLKIYYDDNAYPFSTNLDGIVSGLISRDRSSLVDAEEIISSLAKEESASPHYKTTLFVLAESMLKDIIDGKDWQQDIKTTLDIKAIIEGSYAYDEPIGKALRRGGLKWSVQDGSVYPSIDYMELSRRINGPYTASAEAYLAIKKKEQEQGLPEEFNSIGQVIELYMLLDQFTVNYSEKAIYYQEVNDKKEWYAAQLLNGGVSSKLVKEAYELLQEKYPNHQLTERFRAMGDL